MTSNFLKCLRPRSAESLNSAPFFAALIKEDAELVRQAMQGVDDLFTEDRLIERYAAFLDSGSHAELSESLYRLRHREMIRIIFRDLSRRAATLETTVELSHLADFCIRNAVDHCYAEAVRRHGQPLAPDGTPEKLIVLGMGKLGAYELNLSSDIDLIFFYANQGQVQGGKRVSHQEFFIGLARRVIACLDSSDRVRTVFRVDMAPATLWRQWTPGAAPGQPWRSTTLSRVGTGSDTLLSRRVLWAGDMDEGRDFLRWMKPFVYRRHLDYSAIQSLREMKGLIARQLS